MITEVIKAVISHPVLLSLIGPFLFGGETILVLSILAGQGFVSFWIVLIFCTIGMWLADTMWFLVGRVEPLSKLKKIKWIHKSYKSAKEEIELAPNNEFLLVLIKFAYGIGIPILMYLGRKKMTFKDFMIKNSIVISIWSASIVILGWTIGTTSKIAFNKLENIYTGIALVVTGLIILHFILREIRKRILFKVEHRKV